MNLLASLLISMSENVVQSGDVLGGFPCMDARSRQANALDLQIMSVEISWTWSITSECRHDAGKDSP